MDAPESTALARTPGSAAGTSLAALDPNLVEQVVVGGDLARLTPEQRVSYYQAVCESLGLNPLTRPFDYIRLNDKLCLYAKREATDQLRRIYNISVEIVAREQQNDLYVVTARATTPDGRTDEAVGAVSLYGLTGANLANQIMKCETKAKRRVTLSICGLGWMDDSEVDSVRMARRVQVDDSGEVLEADVRPVQAAGRTPASRAGRAEQDPEREKLLRRWHALCKEAEALGIEVELLPAGASSDEIIRYGRALRQRVDAARSTAA
jgi:hypothetical protein